MDNIVAALVDELAQVTASLKLAGRRPTRAEAEKVQRIAMRIRRHAYGLKAS